LNNQRSHFKQCLFCGTNGKSFNNIEHIIPASLGNKTFTLEKIVCDKCNEYFSKLEEYFIQNHFSSINRLFSVPKTKKGKPPKQNLKCGIAYRDKNGKIVFEQSSLLNDPNNQLSITFFAEDISIKTSYPQSDVNAKKLSRVLAKIGLETLYFKEGEIAYSSEFDLIRHYARFGDTIPFIPFMWHYQTEKNVEILLAEINHQSKDIFYFATIFVSGCVYFIPLHKFNDDFIFNKIANKYSLNKVTDLGLLKREPIEFVLNTENKK